MSSVPPADAFVVPPYPPSRRLVVCDIENLAGGSRATPEAVARCLRQLDAAVCVTPVDVRVVGTGPTLAITLARAGIPAVVLGRGVSGADRALASLLEPAGVAGRYASVVLASGDREFVPAVAALNAVGVPTDVWARPNSVAAPLAAVARSVNILGSSTRLAA